ncbi:hypothetical protein VTN02DRAFT_6595 [Thermoascus thermophilus]
MPPVPPQRGALPDEHPSLSDQDVGLLYQIITRAEQKPDVERLPFRALFAAYDEVVAEHGVDVDQGQVCMRFLFKMGNKGLRGKSIFEKFENLLREMDIVLEYDSDSDADETRGHYPSHVSHLGDGEQGRTTGRGTFQREETGHRARRRRASFNSMYDVGDDPTQRSIAWRPSSRSSMSRLQVGKPDFSGTGTPSRRGSGRGGKRADSPNRTQLLAQFLEAGRRLMGLSPLKTETRRQDKAPLTNGEPVKSGHSRKASNGKTRPSPARSHRRSLSREFDEDEEFLHGANRDDDDDDSIERAAVPPEMIYRPSLSDLLRDASTFNLYRQRAIARRILTQWLKKAVQMQQTHRDMETVAINRDRFTLLRQAFDLWRGILHGRRQVAHTERFFRHLEKRAERARDLYLMTKAFTHWAQVAADQRSRTSAARQHILSVKYFNAWREITAVNELKAQRFGIRKPFYLWKKKTQQIPVNEAAAVATYNRNLTKKLYWRWFWEACDRRAQHWHDYRLKRRSLLCWLRSIRTQGEREHEIDIRNEHFLLGASMRVWSQELRIVLDAQEEADSIYRKKLLRINFDEWRIQARLAPAASQVSDMVNSRIVQAAFEQWVLRFRMIGQARGVDRFRLLRNTWTAWNDRLRCQALSARIEERLKMETLYKWVLAERYRLMRRIREQRVMRETFTIFMTNAVGLSSQLLVQEEEYRARRAREMLRSKLACWREQLARQRQRESVALEFYAPRLEQASLAIWSSKVREMRKMEGWARDARFYFLVTKSIRKWHAATLDSAKRRRQEAYARTRRKIKINMAHNALTSWRSKTENIIRMERQAAEFHRTKVLKTASELFSRWHHKAAKRTRDCHDADVFYYRQLAYDKLARWVDLFNHTRGLEEQAIHFYRLHVSGVAAAQLRKLSLRVFQVRNGAETADAMNERLLKKHFRTMFWHWVRQTRAVLEERQLTGTTATESNDQGAEETKETTAAPTADSWFDMQNAFDFSELVTVPELPPTTPTATPGYLNSPSKRAARARQLAQISTTPATPLYTPFASRLRAELAGERQTTGRRGGIGRGTSFGASVRFVDQVPESPSDGRRSINRRT